MHLVYIMEAILSSNIMFIKTINKLLDIIFPRNAFLRKLEDMEFSEFVECSGGVRIMEYNDVIYFFNFKNSFVRQSIHLLKYKGNKKIANWYGQIIYEYLIEEINNTFLRDKIIIIPVPLSKKKFHSRGWNQSGYIVKNIKEMDTYLFFEYDFNNFVKIKETESQTKMRSKEERKKNILNSFSTTNPEIFYKKSIVVIDDVVTTGSTLGEISNVLKRAGAKSVRKIAIAH